MKTYERFSASLEKTLNDHKFSYGLFALPSFIEGAARLIDFGGTLNVYNESLTTAEADDASLRSDWMAVGFDINDAIHAYERSTQRSGATAPASRG